MLLKFEKIEPHWHTFALERLLVGQALNFGFVSTDAYFKLAGNLLGMLSDRGIDHTKLLSGQIIIGDSLMTLSIDREINPYGPEPLFGNS